MKHLGISLRVDFSNPYGEIRDCLDQRWYQLAAACEFLPVLLPNTAAGLAGSYIDGLNLDALVLSGGNSLSKISLSDHDVSTERDAFEFELLNQMRARNRPVLGVCRGMQVINVYFGGELTPLQSHAGTHHKIDARTNKLNLVIPETVNSYHDFGIEQSKLAKCLMPMALDTQGNVEAFVHENERVSGIMWHPERNDPYQQQDINIMRKLLA